MNYFDQVAKVWNTKERENRTFKIYKKMHEHFFQDNKERTALEIGSGEGLLASLVASSFKEVTCIDTSSNMRKESQKRFSQIGIENISVYDESFIKTTGEKYDLIYSMLAFHHIVDVEEELNILKGLLKEEGKLILVDLDTVSPDFHKDFPGFDGHDGFSKEEIETYLKNTGFVLDIYEIAWSGKKGQVDFNIFLIEASIK